MDPGSRNRVCVVGAGLSGLVSAKVLRADGFDVRIFEREPSLGGVWAASRTYPGLRANNAAQSYAFSDHPYPASVQGYPEAAQVRAYLESYADRFDLRACLQLGSEVAQLGRAAGAHGEPTGFEVAVRPAGALGPTRTLHFDFAVLCNGTFSAPNVPRIDGLERFAGLVRHSSEASDPALFAGRRVIVVGGAKSALDCAAWAARTARSCTLLYRAPHWMGPRQLFGFVRTDTLLHTRLLELFVRYHRSNRLEAFLHGPARPLVRLWWRAVGFLMRAYNQIPAELLPAAPLPTGIESAGIGGDFYEALRRGRAAAKRASIASIKDASSVLLDSGETLEADFLLFATGYRLDLGLLAPELRDAIAVDGSLRLYRRVLPPAEPRLGFIGYASSFATQLTSEISAHWLSQCFRGELELPGEPQMHEEIARVQRWLAGAMAQRVQGYFVGPHVGHFVDELLRDMKQPTRRTRHWFAEYLLPLRSTRYATLHEDRRRARRLPAPPSGLPPR